MMVGLFGKILRSYPYSSEKRILNSMISADSILDLGCSDGKTFYYVGGRNRNYRYAVGVDVFPPYIRSAKGMRIYDDLIMTDIRSLPFKEKSCDVVLFSYVLEHISREENPIKQIENIARKQVIILIPSTFTHQHAHDGNTFQRHLSSYSLQEFVSWGYEVHGIGINLAKLRSKFLRVLYNKYLEGKVPTPLRYIISLITFLSTLLTYSHPEFASVFLCTKINTQTH